MSGNPRFNILFDEELAQKCAPSARLVVWYIASSNGEVIVDSVEFSVVGAFANKVCVFLLLRIDRFQSKSISENCQSMIQIYLPWI